ncbi:hypothetical protein PP914_gp073 [Arthrobacter phage Qui]|jgi:hypothetical protein|uniref:Uncharacterized protein n=1 Tax=Arthrobacter phage Qui TaxID=2603260 RepID=A0A5B8WGE9_9CAUD|nr:hypothetical protein PP914_gp073 [Arthrobacter phage Qui]QED11563.1 hypothetical protein SEA_QUI_73 [Arthrobacter phage Qui]QOC56395.1 hypothetical protein SEA_PAELLA_73 [Arthrobacter phage Paella]
MFKVMLACEGYCEDYAPTREMFRTDDPVEAIRKSEIYRDQSHYSWVEEVK